MSCTTAATSVCLQSGSVTAHLTRVALPYNGCLHTHTSPSLPPGVLSNYDTPSHSRPNAPPHYTIPPATHTFTLPLPPHTPLQYPSHHTPLHHPSHHTLLHQPSHHTHTLTLSSPLLPCPVQVVWWLGHGQLQTVPEAVQEHTTHQMTQRLLTSSCMSKIVLQIQACKN